MSLRELASPIRVYWDIDAAQEDPGIDYRGISTQIADNKILSLQVTEYAPELSAACLGIFDALRDRPVALSLAAGLPALRASSGLARELPVKVLFAAIAAADELESASDVRGQLGGRISFGISFSVNRDNYLSLPDVLSFCIARDISFLLLPMQRVLRDKDCFFLPRKERQTMTLRLGKIAMPSTLKLIIHDPFLWRIFYPEVEFPDGGCQAANTMIYIAPDAGVYPCPVVPVRIGDLRKNSLRDILRSTAKKEARNSLVLSPPGCADCEEFDSCKGGCRGRALVMTNSLEGADPGCR